MTLYSNDRINMLAIKIILSSIIIFSMFSLSKLAAYGEVRVKVANHLGSGRSLNVHCQSRDDDLGYMRIQDGVEIEWEFGVNFWGTTLFYCDVQWGDSEWYHFDAYSSKRDYNRCEEKCLWMINEEGFLFGYNEENENWEFRPWGDA